MLGVAQGANQRDDVEAELALRQSEGAFLLQLVRVAIELALGICASRWLVARTSDHEGMAAPRRI
jgi:hypothetical protein